MNPVKWRWTKLLLDKSKQLRQFLSKVKFERRSINFQLLSHSKANKRTRVERWRNFAPAYLKHLRLVMQTTFQLYYPVQQASLFVRFSLFGKNKTPRKRLPCRLILYPRHWICNDDLKWKTSFQCVWRLSRADVWNSLDVNHLAIPIALKVVCGLISYQ